MRATLRARRGFTLIELIITASILSVVMALVGMALVAQQRSFWSNERQRDAQSQARTALTFLEKDLMMAGYGLEPALGLDFNVSGKNGARCAPVGGVPAAPAASADWPTALADSLCNRDNVNRPDEVVVHYRDPEYWGQDLAVAPIGHAWGAVGGAANVDRGTNRLKLNLRPGDTLAVGRVLQLVCPGGQDTAYVTVKTRAQNTTAAVAPLWVEFEAAEVGNPLRQTIPAQGCFDGAGVRAFVVLTRHYYVEADVASGIPYLFLDEGFDRDGDGAVGVTDRVVVAEGIEDLQVAYNLGVGATESRVGTTPGAVLSACGLTARPIPAVVGACAGKDLRLVDFSADADLPRRWSYLGFSSQSPVRLASDAANVRSITFGVVARSLVPNRDGVSGTAPPLLFNRNAALPAAGNFNRALVTGSVRPNNLLARGLPYL